MAGMTRGNVYFKMLLPLFGLGCCGSKAYHLQKSTCGKCGYPAKQRESIIAVLKLKDQIPPGLVE